MKILAIDPGPTKSAFAFFEDGRIGQFGIEENWKFIHNIGCKKVHDEVNVLAIEMIASYGMPVGETVFETCVWIGRFMEAFGGPCTRIKRKDVCLHLCNSPRANDSTVRQALIDRFGSPGTKKDKNCGPLYGMAGDEWAALAVAVTYWDKHRKGEAA